MPKDVLIDQFLIARVGNINKGGATIKDISVIAMPNIRLPRSRRLNSVEEDWGVACSTVGRLAAALALADSSLYVNPSSLVAAEPSNRAHPPSASQYTMRSTPLHRMKPLPDATKGLASRGGRGSTGRGEVVGPLVAPRATLSTISERHLRLHPI